MGEHGSVRRLGSSMSKVRVYEVARELGLDNEAIVAACHSVGLADVRHHTNAITADAAASVRRHVEQERQQRIRATVIRRSPRRTSQGLQAPSGSALELQPSATNPEDRAAAAGVPSTPEVSAVGPEAKGTQSSAAEATLEVSSVVPIASAPREASPEPPVLRPRRTGVEIWVGRPGIPRWQPPRTKRHPSRRVPRSRLEPKEPTVTPERAARKKVVRIDGSVSIRSLAAKMGVKASDLLMKLLALGAAGIHVNSTLDAETSKIVANELGWDVENVAITEEAAIEAARGGTTLALGMARRPPVVTVMGHVDHGKTSLLDRIRKTSVAAQEAGGITQHIGAYSVATPQGRITFLDTPGHEAFTSMRARGAQCTDIVVLVVAADDGVMPQTKEAMNHARASGVPIVVALTKVDKVGARSERVRRGLAELGLVPEQWGGDTLYAEVSSVTGQGIDDLLERILLQAEVLDLRASPDIAARGVVIEAKLDRGKGPLATVLVKDGTLHTGDAVIAGSTMGRIRAMYDDSGQPCSAARPATPVAIVGLAELPSAGDPVDVVADLARAQSIAGRRVREQRERSVGSAVRPSLDGLVASLGGKKEPEVKIVLKADTRGSVDALTSALGKLSTEGVRLSVVHSAVGGITESDVALAAASGGIIVGFNVSAVGKARTLAERDGVRIRFFRVIYELLDETQKTMLGMLEPKRVEQHLGRADVRRLFKLPKVGTIAGCVVTEGVIRRHANTRVVRDGVVLWEGRIDTLRHLKDDVAEIKQGLECGVSLKGYGAMEEGDILEVFEVSEHRLTH